MTDTRKKLVILISGSGSNLQTFIDQCASGELPADIACVISNKASAYGLERAQIAGIPTRVIEHQYYNEREKFDEALADVIDSYQPNLVILAGFMRILTDTFVNRFLGRLINIHPSLLPKYTGLHTHQRAIDAGDTQAGATVHFVTPELDGGPAIIQASVNIDPNDDAISLAKKILVEEHKIFPLAAKWFLQDRLRMKEDGIYLDHKKLPHAGYHFEC